MKRPKRVRALVINPGPEGDLYALDELDARLIRTGLALLRPAKLQDGDRARLKLLQAVFEVLP